VYNYSFSQKKHRADAEIWPVRIKYEGPVRILNLVCERGKVCIGQSGRTVETRCKEHQTRTSGSTWEASSGKR